MNRTVRAVGLAAAAIFGIVGSQAQAQAVQPVAAVTPAVQVQATATMPSVAQITPAVLQTVPTVAQHPSLILPGQASLEQLAEQFAATDVANADEECLANAVYFEARGEPLDGQLAVAQVVLNRAGSGRYPPDICAVVKQPWQFSFVRNGRFPQANRGSAAWRRAVAITRIARNKLVSKLSNNVLWYHADYVAPSWGRRLTRQTKIGLHIFYS